jgi:catechol 2,3-dioxygenase-like lactoylglutathione lyase family enzyme
MKRMHIHVGVADLEQGVNFYSALFGAEPAKLKADYAKWMLDDPRINFAISTRGGKAGVDHLGLQVDDEAELQVLRDRFRQADLSVFDEGETTCCYARSEKTWLQDPAGVPWEAYVTLQDAQLFGAPGPAEAEPAACCPASEAAPVEAADSGSGCCAP